jgi:hypothetical protein
VSASQSTTTAGQLVTVIASCPSGFAVGGGFASHPTISGTNVEGIYFVYESRPTSLNSWKLSAIRQDGTGPHPLTAYVDCRSGKLPAKKGSSSKKKKKRKLRITEAAATGTATTDTEASATASCPPKTQALTGGFSISPNPVSGSLPLIERSFRTGPGAWTSAFFNIGSVARTVTSYAYCASGLNVTDSVGTATIPGSTGSTIGGATAVSAPCPVRRALLGGGFNLPSLSATNPGAVAIINTSQPVGGSWQITALNDSPNPGTIESHGYCA